VRLFTAPVNYKIILYINKNCEFDLCAPLCNINITATCLGIGFNRLEIKDAKA